MELNTYSEVKKDKLTADIMHWAQQQPAYRHSATQNLVNEIFAQLRGSTMLDAEMEPPFFIGSGTLDASNYVSMANGIVNINALVSGSGEVLSPPNPDFFTFSGFSYDYDPIAECPVWERVISELLPDRVAVNMYQEWLGLNLVHDTSFQKFLVMYGTGSNGKSVACAVHRALAPLP